MGKYLLVFPGIGYTEDKPLLYYSRKLAEKHGYSYVRLDKYEPLAGDIKNDLDARRQMIAREYERLIGAMSALDIKSDDEILVLAKSVGAAIAARYLKECPYKFKAIYFTPIPEMFDAAPEASGIVFHGTGDPWADTEIITKGCRDYGLREYITEGANHSLETGNVSKDISELQKVMAVCEEYISG